ncbi:hypothetical protein BS50DRAFT_79482 [Corynespora cassiicola Philippines]|uniref:Uncharacterized protein n=1 Tax=Corynespora cassiicola Philippines TaxID=1448308 RepID=A0A2T2NH44_CORCC|nr:hypothetical protein BS50DRAFT_79482 [Corynespora cassiicola Philippines]
MTSYRQYSEVFPNHRPDRYGLGDGSGNYQLGEELDMQRHISQQTHSPGFGSAYGSPPTPTKTLTSNHQHLSSQPRGYEANPPIVHQPNASDMIRSASSPVAPYSSGASDLSFYAVSGTALRHDSFDLDSGSAS